MVNKPLSNENRKLKKELITGKNQNPKRINTLLVVVTIAALAGAIGAVYFITSGADRGGRTIHTSARQAVETSEIRHTLSLFSDGKARHFQHQANGITIRYFIIKSSDGVVRAAFDACDVCWPSGKGYYQDGDAMVCRNCGRRFASLKVNEVKGGCNPAPLNRVVEGDQLVIQMDDLLQGQHYFNFKGKA